MSNENKKLMDYQEQLVENQTGINVREDAAICKDIVTNPPSKNKMPEFVFQYIFAPYFACLRDPEIDKTKLNSELKGRWIGIAGSMYNGVDLVDNKGNVVDTTPGFYCQPDKMEGMDNVDFTKIVTTYKQKKSRLLVEGERYISGELKSLEDGVVSKSKKTLFDNEWDRLLNKYTVKAKKEELSPISKEAEKNTPEDVKKKLDITDDELDYD